LKKGPRDNRSRKRKHQVTKKEADFEEKLTKLFDIAALDDAQDKERLPFLIDQRTDRVMKLGGRVGVTGVERRKQKLLEKQKIRAEKEAVEKEKRFRPGLLAILFFRLITSVIVNSMTRQILNI
jgi:hypothetical protein